MEYSKTDYDQNGTTACDGAGLYCLYALAVGELTDKNFGLLIAFLIPGLIAVWGMSDHFPILGQWLGASPAESPTIGGFLYATIASAGAGLVVSALRWLIVDTIHHRTGVSRPDWDFEELQENYAAFTGAVANHYRFYQAYANTLVSLALALAARLLQSGTWPDFAGPIPVLLAALAAVLFAASRDALKKYYARTAAILRSHEGPEGEPDDDQRLASQTAAPIRSQAAERAAVGRPARSRRRGRSRNRSDDVAA